MATRSLIGVYGGEDEHEYEVLYNVRFVGDLFYLSTTVKVSSGGSDAAIDAAIVLLRDHYGWDLESVSDVEVSAELAYPEVVA